MTTPALQNRKQREAFEAGSAKPTVAQWLQQLKQHRDAQQSAQWAIGDALVYGERRFKDSYILASRVTRYAVATLRDIAYVSRNVATSLRNDNLEWNHHRAVAPLGPGEQRRFLTLAAQQSLSVPDIRDAIQRRQKQLAQSEYGRVFTDDQIIDDAFRHYRALVEFPHRKLPLHMCRQQINKLAETTKAKLLNTTVGYKVADTYHPHRFHAKASGMRSPVDAFFDDKALRKALKLTLEFGGTISDELPGALSVVNGTQACSNFRPGFATMLYQEYCKKGDTVLDTSTGYGGRLVGFMGSGIKGKYIGIDPNTETHAGNARMANELGFGDAVELINLPAEDVDVDKYKLRGRCDFAFTSPPYFSKELYSDEPTQSCNRYKTADAWRAGFLIPMLKLQFDALKPGALCIVNIAEVKIKGKTYPLDAWTREEAIKIGFEYKKTRDFPMTRRMGSGLNEVAQEPVLVFQKGLARK
jgi:hypothetical protein